MLPSENLPIRLVGEAKLHEISEPAVHKIYSGFTGLATWERQCVCVDKNPGSEVRAPWFKSCYSVFGGILLASLSLYFFFHL